MKEFSITANDENQRLDKYLKKLLPNATTGFFYKMLRKKNITLNGKKAEGSEKLKAQDKICLYLSDETFLKFSKGEDTILAEFEALKLLPMKGLKVISEDADVLIASKPAGMLSQKAKEDDLSANEYLLGYLIRSGALSYEDYRTFHPSVANRLDRNTSGLLIFGKTLKGLQEMTEGLKDRTIQKYYRCIVVGRIEKPSALKGYLRKDESTNRVFITEEKTEGSAPIRTEYTPIAANEDYTLLEVHLITGKTHQIRAHLASIGHPVLGDAKYGDEAANAAARQKFGLKYQLLHAYRLTFADGREVESEVPELFERVINISRF